MKSTALCLELVNSTGLFNMGFMLAAGQQENSKIYNIDVNKAMHRVAFIDFLIF